MIESKKIVEELNRFGSVSENVPMSSMTSFGIGGNARFVFTPKDGDGLKSFMQIIAAEGIDYFVLGNGTNLLCSDAGYEGAVIHIGGSFNEIKQMEVDMFSIGAGCSLNKSIIEFAKQGWCGYENLSGIPGSIGGAIKMNAGAYDVWIGDRLISIVAVYRGKEVTFAQIDLHSSYRNGGIPSGAIIIGAIVGLERNEPAKILSAIEDIKSRRISTQPLTEKSAGCVFKNPAGKHAGQMIDDAGLKGFTIGGAQISLKHANFIINTGNAKATDVLALIEHVREVIDNKYGIYLETEIIKLGFGEYESKV